jgi:hypothetical protein
MDSDEWIEFGKLFGAGEPSVKNGIENFSGRPRKSPVHERGVGDATVIAGLYPAAAWIGAVTSGAGADARQFDGVFKFVDHLIFNPLAGRRPVESFTTKKSSA